MGRRGRKSKPNKVRTNTGRISRAKAVNNNDAPKESSRPSAWVDSQRDKFGVHYNTALGRAFVSGLLGEGQEANDRYAEAKRFARVYARTISQDRYRCALDRTPRGNLALAEDPDEIAYEIEQQQWLFEAMAKIDATGCRPFFDQLISTLHTDRGPYWIDALISGHTHPADVAVLNAALKAIDAITPKRVARIVAS